MLYVRNTKIHQASDLALGGDKKYTKNHCTRLDNTGNQSIQYEKDYVPTWASEKIIFYEGEIESGVGKC